MTSPLLRTLKRRRALVGAVTGTLLAGLAVWANISEVVGDDGTLRAWEYLADTVALALPRWVLVSVVIVLVSQGWWQLSLRTRKKPYRRWDIPSEGRFFEHLRERLSIAQEEVLVSFIGKSWVFMLVLTIIRSRQRGIPITVLVDDADKHDRYQFLQLLGCEVVRVSLTREPPFCGVLIDPSNPLHGSVICLSIRPKDGHFANIHHCPHDHYLIASVAAQLRAFIPAQPSTNPAFRPVITRTEASSVLTSLRQVRFYRDAEIRFEEVPIADTVPRTRVVVSAKVKQAEDLISFFQSQDWRLFEPASVLLANNRLSLIVPPVLEYNEDGGYLVVEGHSRIFALRSQGIRSVFAIVVRKVVADLPGASVAWRGVRLQDDREALSSPEWARHIETATHLEVWPPSIAAEGRQKLATG